MVCGPLTYLSSPISSFLSLYSFSSPVKMDELYLPLANTKYNTFVLDAITQGHCMNRSLSAA